MAYGDAERTAQLKMGILDSFLFWNTLHLIVLSLLTLYQYYVFADHYNPSALLSQILIFVVGPTAFLLFKAWDWNACRKVGTVAPGGRVMMAFLSVPMLILLLGFIVPGLLFDTPQEERSVMWMYAVYVVVNLFFIIVLASRKYSYDNAARR